MKKPNIIFLTLHDTGRHFGAYGVPTLSTPVFDRIGREGVLMTDLFCSTPICSASRASMLTGLYPMRHGQLDLPVWGYDLHPDVLHLSQRLSNAGYDTHLFGLQHETAHIDRLAFSKVWKSDPSKPGKRPANEIADQVAGFLASRKPGDSKPFYLQVGFFETHSPFDFADCPEDHARGVAIPAWIKPTGPAYELMAKLQGALKRVDTAIGEIDRALHQAGLADDTLLIYTTDHGLELPRAKWTLYDPGVTVGLVARWPAGGVSGGRVCDAMSCNIDLTPTVLDLAGLGVGKRPDGGELDGRSLARAWRGQSDPDAKDVVFGFYLKNENRSIRTRTHKLILNAGVRAGPRPPVDISDTTRNGVVPPLEFFDLINDPLETKNLVGDKSLAGLEKSLFDRLWAHLVWTDDLILKGPLDMQWRQNRMADFRARAGA